MDTRQIVINVIDNFDRKYPYQRQRACAMSGKCDTWMSNIYFDSLNWKGVSRKRLEELYRVIQVYEESINYGVDNKTVVNEMIEYFMRKNPSVPLSAVSVSGGEYKNFISSTLQSTRRNKNMIRETVVDRVQHCLDSYDMKGALNEA